jgi:hypothetical protein
MGTKYQTRLTKTSTTDAKAASGASHSNIHVATGSMPALTRVNKDAIVETIDSLFSELQVPAFFPSAYETSASQDVHTQSSEH